MESRRSQLIDDAVVWCSANNRWPTATCTPLPATTAARRFGSWNSYKEAVRKTYIEKNGYPEWDRPVEKVTPMRQAVLSEVAQTIEAALLQINALPVLSPQKVKKTSVPGEDESELHLVISDVHVGELTTSALTAGISSYDFETFLRSADILEERVLFFKQMYGKAFKIRKLVINFIGDIVTGESIFLGQQLQIDRIVTEQVFEAAQRFAVAFRNWAPHFDEVEVICIPGNHGRIGKKNELSYLANFDYIAYRVVAILCKDIQNMKFIIAEGPTVVIRHGDFTWMIHHGDSIPGSGGAKGNFISLERKMEKFASMMDIPIHYSVSGHQHTSASVARNGFRRIIQNGAWPGGSEFSVEVLGSANVPVQKLLLFHPRKGIHSETDIILGERRVFNEDENRVLTANYRTAG